jgi:hypothetical protein
MLSFHARHYLVMGWSIVICILILSLLPGSSLPKYRWQDLVAADKLGHFVFYGAAAWNFTRYQIIRFSIPKLWMTGSLLFFMGLSVELLQSYSSLGRSFDALDQLANTAGILFGLFGLRK